MVIARLLASLTLLPAASGGAAAQPASASAGAVPSGSSTDQSAAPAGRITPYGEKGLFHGGYCSREEQPGHWTVNARVYANEQPSRAFMIALYRSAQLVSAKGYGAFKVNGQALKTTSIVSGYTNLRVANYLAILNVVAVGSPAGDQPCVMKNPRACLELTTARAFEIAGPTLQMPVAPPTAAVDAAR